MFKLKRTNALTPIQGVILAKLVNNETISPKSMNILNSIFK